MINKLMNKYEILLAYFAGGLITGTIMFLIPDFLIGIAIGLLAWKITF